MQGNGSTCAGHGGVVATNGGTVMNGSPIVAGPVGLQINGGTSELSQPTNAPSLSTPAQAATPTTSASSCWSLFQGDPCLGPIGMGTLAIGVVALIAVMSIFGGHK